MHVSSVFVPSIRLNITLFFCNAKFQTKKTTLATLWTPKRSKLAFSQSCKGEKEAYQIQEVDLAGGELVASTDVN